MSEAVTADGYRSMDVTFNNVLEGTRQYFLGVPKQVQAEGSGQPVWPAGAPPPEEGTPALSGAPAPSSRPPSAAAAPPSVPPTVMAVPVPPRPPSEPLEPEPHIIHKATVMREAAEKRREMPEVEDEEEPIGTLSPPSHIIRKPPRTLPSPAPAPSAPCPSPARPPSAAPLAATPHNPSESQLEPPSQYRPPAHRVPTPTARPPDHFAPGRPPDPYSASRPPESYMRYHYETSLQDGGRSSHGPPIASPQPSLPARHSPQTYARISSSLPQHSVSRLRDTAVQSPPAQRYVMPATQPPPPHNDRVPPIHHPQAAPPPQRLDVRANQAYSPLQHRRETSPYGRVSTHYDRHSVVPTRKYDPQQAYPGYRPSSTTTSQPLQNHRIEAHHPTPYKHVAVEVMNAHYTTRPPDRAPTSSQLHPHDTARLPPRVEYPNMGRTIDARSGYHYATPSTSTARYPTNAQVPVVQNATLPSRPAYRAAATTKTNYDYPASNSVQTSPARSSAKPGYTNQQSRMTVSVTSLVNQMNQTKQKRESPISASANTTHGGQPKKRESPLDLSVKTVKNSADSSTTQDDAIDSATVENKTLPIQSRPTSSSRQHVPPGASYGASHKVDFAPNFSQYRDRSVNHANINMGAQSNHPVRYNGSYESRRPGPEQYPVESPHHIYPERNKYSVPVARTDYVPRIDLTRPVSEQRHESRIRDDRAYIDDRKRSAGPIVSNIPEKIVRYETWSSDSRIEHNMNQLAREQNELISRPVYSYSSHKQFEAYQKEQKRPAASNYHDHHSHVNHRYPYPQEVIHRESSDYHPHYHDRSLPSNNRHHVIQKMQSHRDIHTHHHIDSHIGVPADKRVLSILRNSLETKQTGYVEPARPARQIPDLIVIDDVDDSVIEITDLTKETDSDINAKNASKPIQSQTVPSLSNHIQMPKAVDSIIRDTDYNKYENNESKSKSPENDVASRIRTKAELKVMPPSQDNSVRQATVSSDNEIIKLQPKSQKQHLFNQIREDNLRLESVIKSEKQTESTIPEVKSEPMNIDEIEKDAQIPIKTENILQDFEPEKSEAMANEAPEEDLDWANACDSFVEQLKIGCHKKKAKRRRDTERDGERSDMYQKQPTANTQTSDKFIDELIPNIVIKQEPMDEDESETLASIAQSSITLDTSQNEIQKDETQNSEMADDKQDKITKDEEKDTVKDKKSDSIAKDRNPDKISKDVKDKKLESKADAKKQDCIDIKSESTLKEKKQDSVTIDKKQDVTVKDKKQDKNKKQERKQESSKSQDKDKTIDSSSVQEKTKNSSSLKNKIQDKSEHKSDKIKNDKKALKDSDKTVKKNKTKLKSEKSETSSASSSISIKKEIIDNDQVKIKEEAESTDDDEPLIKSKLLKEKERSEQLKYQLLKDLSEKSAYVKLECCDVDVNKNTRKSLDSTVNKDKEDKQNKCKFVKSTSRSKGKSSSIENNKTENDNDDLSSDSDDDLSVASRLRMRKTIKSEDGKISTIIKTPIKSSPSKKQESNNNNASTSTLIRKPGFGDGSDFHPGWEEELYRYKRSLRMPPRLIAIPRGRSGGPFPRGSGAFFTRGSTSLPDLDPAPLSPAPSSAPSVATDDLYTRRPDKLTLDSDLESNSSSSAVNRLHYDSEASTSTVFSTSGAKKKSSIVDMLIKKCGRKEDTKKKSKEKDEKDKAPKLIPKNTNLNELLPTPSLGLVKNGNKGSLSAKKEKLMEDIFYLGAFRKETVTAFRNAFIKNTDGLIGATEEFAPVVLKSRTRTESRVLKQRATIKEVFGDERPASAPPSSFREDEQLKEDEEEEEEKVVEIKKEPEVKPKFKPKKIVKNKLLRRSSSIRDGLRSTKSLKRNDAKGRLLRLKKRNSLMKSSANKRIKDGSGHKHKKDNSSNIEGKDGTKDESTSPPNADGNTKRRLKRLFGRRKFSSGFDYIRKKKKIIRREDTNNTNNKIRRPAAKPSPESIHDIHKEIKSWFINKSIGETHLHRAARLGYTDCVAYCLEKMESDPCAKDNAGFTPLHVASAKGHVRIARLLLQYGANVSAAAQGGIRPLHEACENAHVEVIRLLLSYGADPLLGTYAGQTPEELAEGPAARLIHLHISDVQGQAVEPWRFPHPAEIIDYEEIGCDPLASPPPGSPPPPPDSMIEIQTTDAPLPPFYTLRTAPGQPSDGLWCLLQDITNLLQIKSKESLLKQIHCGSGSPKELLREIRTQEFLERAQCHQLLCAGEKVNVRASKVALIRVTDKLRQLLKIETVLVS